MDEEDPVVKYFSRHLVVLRLFLQRGEEKNEFRISTLMVLSVSEKWYLATARHYFLDKEKGLLAFLDAGWKINSCQLIDCLGPDSVDKFPVPFPFHINEWKMDNEEEDQSFDFAALPLSDYFRDLLSANGIVALNEQVWEKQPTQPQGFALLGVPEELIEVGTEYIRIVPVLHYIEPLPEKPEGFKTTSYPLFYGCIGLADQLESIKGESGGPIFAFQRNEKGELLYWLVALQSRWLPESKYIAACPTKVLGVALRDYFGKVNSIPNEEDV